MPNESRWKPGDPLPGVKSNMGPQSRRRMIAIKEDDDLTDGQEWTADEAQPGPWTWLQTDKS